MIFSLFDRDPVEMMRLKMEQSLKLRKPKMPQEDSNKLSKFLEFDKKCLRFNAYWDDRCSLTGDVHNLIIYYFLCDDTIQISEISRQGKSSTLFKRQKLPKVILLL